MAENMPYRPESGASLGTEQPVERLVFVHPKDDGRVFEVARPQVMGADSPEVGQEVANARAAVYAARAEAVTRQPEQDAMPGEREQSIARDGQAIAATREYAEVNGL
jgi:hypothetical protein